MIFSLLILLIVLAVALLFISAAMAPIESLGWWAGWFGEGDPIGDEQALASENDGPEASTASHYMVYLSGIGAITADSIPDEEIMWLERLQAETPGTDLVTDVFPYSVTNLGLTGQRFFARIWRWVEQRRFGNPMAISALLVNIRNMLQVAVSADPRYGPIYNLGVAREIVEALKNHGYRANSGTPITMLGWSGGGQISLGCVPFIAGMLKGPVRLISIGGVMADDPGLKTVEHVYHIYGDKDPVQGLGAKLYAGRWPISKQSDWNRAVAEGKITMIGVGPFTHMGAGNYWDWEAKLPDGRPHAQATLDTVKEILVQDGLLVPSDNVAVDQPSRSESSVDGAHNGRPGE